MLVEKPLLSLVILCFKEEEYIPVFIRAVKEALQKHAIPHELILVANFHAGSTDRSSNIVQEMAKSDPSLLAVTLEKQGKMGWDLWSGFKKATGGVVGFTDGDGQIAPEDIARAYEKIIAEDFDMVQGQRIERCDGRMRKITSVAYSLILRSCFPKITVHDINGKPKLFKKRRLDQMKLTSTNWFADSELVIQAAYRNFKIGTIPTVFYKNTRRPSTTSPWSIFESLRDIAQYRTRMLLHKKELLQ